MTTAPSEPTSDAALARDLLDALLRAVAARRQLGPQHPLADVALQQLRRRTGELPLAAEIVIDLHATTARCGGSDVLHDPHGLLLAPLRALGVGRLVLPPAASPAALQQLAVDLAAADAEAGDGLVGRLRAFGSAAPRLLPASAPPAAETPVPATFDQLPPAAAASPASRAAAAREAALNLPVRIARLLLQDLEQAPAAEPLLQQTADLMAGRNDVAGCAMLLEQAQHHPQLGPAARQAIAGAALRLFRSRLGGPALVQAGGAGLLTLAGLAVQLGSGAVAELLQAAGGAGVPLPDWLREAIDQP